MASATTPHPVLDDVLARFPEVITLLGPVDDARPYYRHAGAALIPSFTNPGVKITILQAWAAGCPVVTTRPAADALGVGDGKPSWPGTAPRTWPRLWPW